MYTFMSQVAKQVLLGVGMAAGQALVETGQQITVNALQKKMSEWGVNLDSESFLGMFTENLKNNLGFQASFMIMNATDKIFDSQLDKLREASLENEKAIANSFVSKVSSAKSSLGGSAGNVGKVFWKSVKNSFSGRGTSADDVVNSIAQDEISKELSAERLSLQEKGKQFLEHRKTTGSVFNGLAVGSGTINTSNNHNFSDDTKIFDAVMMMMNMKKVG